MGNLNTNRVTRDDVIQMFKSYGTLAGVTLFKGYAFVQYFHSSKADLAVSALNGYNWNGSVLGRYLSGWGSLKMDRKFLGKVFFWQNPDEIFEKRCCGFWEGGAGRCQSYCLLLSTISFLFTILYFTRNSVFAAFYRGCF